MVQYLACGFPASKLGVVVVGNQVRYKIIFYLISVIYSERYSIEGGVYMTMFPDT